MDKQDKYFMIYNFDGDTMVKTYDKATLQQEIDNECNDYDFLSKIPDDDTNYWDEKVLIIKGQIVVPKPVQTVTKYEL